MSEQTVSKKSPSTVTQREILGGLCFDSETIRFYYGTICCNVMQSDPLLYNKVVLHFTLFQDKTKDNSRNSIVVVV